MTKDFSKGLKGDRARWDAQLKNFEAKKPPRPERFTTLSDMEVPLLSTPIEKDTSADFYSERLGFPGEYPYTRGVFPNMYRGKLWTMRQFAGFGNARQTNERFKLLLEQGQMGLSTAFDLPTLMGVDADAPSAKGEVGKCGADDK